MSDFDEILRNIEITEKLRGYRIPKKTKMSNDQQQQSSTNGVPVQQQPPPNGIPIQQQQQNQVPPQPPPQQQQQNGVLIVLIRFKLFNLDDAMSVSSVLTWPDFRGA
jgi:hypothetical protein